MPYKKLPNNSSTYKPRDLNPQEVAYCFSLTRERLRQIEARALKKMRIELIKRDFNSAI